MAYFLPPVGWDSLRESAALEEHSYCGCSSAVIIRVPVGSVGSGYLYPGGANGSWLIPGRQTKQPDNATSKCLPIPCGGANLASLRQALVNSFRPSITPAL